MANLIDTINSKVSNIAGQTGSGTNYGIKKRTPVVPAQTTPGGMSVAPNFTAIKTTPVAVKGTTISAPIVPPVTNNSVTGAKLAPVTPVVLPEQVKDTTPSNLSNAVTSDAMAGVDTYTKELEAIKNKDTSSDTIANLMKSISGVQTTEDTLANQLGKDTNLAEYNRLASDLELEKNNARRQIEDIQKSNPTGALRGGQLDLIANIERDSARKQGDLAFEANARLGAYDKAVSIAKKQVEMEIAPMKAELDRLQYLQDYNKEFRTAEIDAVKQKKQNQIKREEERLTKGNEMIISAMQFGAPSSLVIEAKDVLSKGGDVVKLAQKLGKYNRDLDMEIKKSTIAKNWADAQKNDVNSGTLSEKQLKQIDTSPQGKKLVSLSGLFQKSQTYKNLVDTYGFQAVGKEKTLLDNAYADLKIAYKEAANLGALTGPDVLLIEEAIKPTSGPLNYLNYRVSGGQKGVSGGIDQALMKAKKEALQNYKQLTARDANYRNSDYVNQLLTPFAADYSNVDLENVQAGEIIQTEDGVLLEALGGGQFSPL